MASCKQQSDCTAQEVCSDGQCVPVEVPEERQVRRTFATAKGEYIGQIKGEQQMLEDFGEFLTGQLEEATEERAEQQENTGFWGTVGSIVGFGLGCFLGAGNPIGCKTGATVGASIGSLASRGAADWLDDAESYKLEEDEISAQLDPAQLKYLRGTYQDLVDDARDMQADLDDYDRNEWKQHVLGTIGDTWNAYKMAGFGETLWEGGGKVMDWAKNISDKEDIIDIAPDISKTIEDVADVQTMLDFKPEELFPTYGGSSATGWNE